jgi:hypothetical protein
LMSRPGLVRAWIAMSGKRHHYIPRLLLRRFTIDPDAKQPVIWHLDKATGQTRRSNVINEAVIGRYYRMTLPDGTVVDEADALLGRIEGMVGEVLPKLEEDRAYVATGDDFFRLMLFIISLKNRTPRAREALRETDMRTAEIALEAHLSDRERYHCARSDAGLPAEQVEAERLQCLDDLRAGRLLLDSSPEREIALMFLGLDEKSARLLDALNMTCVRIPERSRKTFVLSDHPVSHYDPTPKSPDAGAGFLSSPNSVTWVPLDPKFGLLLGQRVPGDWRIVEFEGREVDELNMQTYASRSALLVAVISPHARRVRRCRSWACGVAEVGVGGNAE